MMLGHQTQATITFSPPEELPQRGGLSVPTSWKQEGGPRGEPLFTRDQIRRAEELQAQAPLLFPTTATPVVVPPSSERTSRTLRWSERRFNVNLRLMTLGNGLRFRGCSKRYFRSGLEGKLSDNMEMIALRWSMEEAEAMLKG